jgi:ring-1,2-phenylacetyl-CoA epoxidase subunit PaaB
MTADTQWPRFEVLQQTREGAPFASVGTVHAADAEMALQNARDVFVRRPQTYRLAVVPADQVLARTAEELEADPAWRQRITTEDVPTRPYLVLGKRSQRSSMTFVNQMGRVVAQTAWHALARAVARWGEDGVYVWWVVPEEALVISADADADSMFAPAHDKTYRLPGDYRTRTMMDEVRRRDDEGVRGPDES